MHEDLLHWRTFEFEPTYTGTYDELFTSSLDIKLVSFWTVGPQI